MTQTWLNALAEEDRRMVGKAKEVAKIILASPDQLKQLFSHLKKNSDNGEIVAHGYYALKEIALADPKMRVEILQFCKSSLKLFEMWEAKENMIRIALIDLKKDLKLHQLITPLLDDPSSIVQAYALEYLLRYAYSYDKKQLPLLQKRFEKKKRKAAVQARMRKIQRELKL